ncbi:hypothetical protein ASF08_21940 [Methylobacterium sp. Leaf85]|nr:hypothetical protein ASF08_21940 [Methylobacterium sp. Leaf85]
MPRLLLPRAVRYAGGAAPGSGEGTHLVPARNRFSRVVLAFDDLAPDTWCSLTFGLAWDGAETAGSAIDFALVGVDFLARDGSSLDFDQVPGLDRTLLDPHGAWVAGPAYQLDEQGTRTGLVRLAFLVPAPAVRVTVTVRSWRNTHPFVVSEAVLGQGPSPSLSPRPRRRFGPEPDWLDYALVPGSGLVLRGQLFTARPGAHAALARVVYRDADGTVLPPPYPGTIAIPALGALIDLSAQQQARRFTLALAPVAGAARVQVGFATWEADDAAGEAELLGAPEVSLEDRLRLESLCGDDLLAAEDFLARVAERLAMPVAAMTDWCPQPEAVAPLTPVLARARTIQRGDAHRAAGLDRTLRLAGAPVWTLPSPPAWGEDPFRSVPWRIEYQSLGWLIDIAETPGGASTAVGLALSWSRANPWGALTDGLAMHPAALAVRTEIFVRLLALAGKAGGAASLTLVGEAARHGFALAEIIGQNTFGRSLHQIQTAAVLLGLARALPRLPLSDHWLSLAGDALRDGLAPLLEEPPRFPDATPHQRLELATLLRSLSAAAFGDVDLEAVMARAAAAALSSLAGLLDPGGRLPPFGDAPHGEDHAGWIGRLRAAPARGGDAERWSAQARDLRERPSLPRPKRDEAADRLHHAAGLLAMRHDAPGRGWGYFACASAASTHRDATSFVYSSEGVRWIVEAGGSSQVETGVARHFLRSASAHNVAMPDRREPMAGEAWHVGTTRLDGASLHVLATNGHGPDYLHTRIFAVLDDLSGLVVLDRFMAGDRPVAFEGGLHFSPGILVALAGPHRAMAQSGRARLSLTPTALRGRQAGLALVNGDSARAGRLQGFVTSASGLQPTTVLRYALAGTGEVCGGMVLAGAAEADRRLAALLADSRLLDIAFGE